MLESMKKLKDEKEEVTKSLRKLKDEKEEVTKSLRNFAETCT